MDTLTHAEPPRQVNGCAAPCTLPARLAAAIEAAVWLAPRYSTPRDLLHRLGGHIERVDCYCDRIEPDSRALMIEHDKDPRCLGCRGWVFGMPESGRGPRSWVVYVGHAAPPEEVEHDLRFLVAAGFMNRLRLDASWGWCTWEERSPAFHYAAELLFGGAR